MTPFDCGCTPDGTDRCARHVYFPCHFPYGPGVVAADKVCPPCRIAQWRSVSLSAEATPTRNQP